jgi:hypothetical protein
MSDSFTSPHAFYDFSNHVRTIARYVRDGPSEDFLRTFISQAEGKFETIPKGSALWRAQLGCDWQPEYQEGEYIADNPIAWSPERMLPLKDRAPEGRVNPKGISFLYCATRQKTAMAEVRPSIGSYVSVAQLEILKDLRIVNCTTEDKPKRFLTKDGFEIPREDWDKAVWHAIDGAFARPVERSDDLADYVPTQIIGEAIKSKGWDGVGYRSALGDGHNIALFDLGVVRVVAGHVFQTRSITFDLQECWNPYFVPEPKDQDKG